MKGRRNERGGKCHPTDTPQRVVRIIGSASPQHFPSLLPLHVSWAKIPHGTKAPCLSFPCRRALRCAARRRVSVQYEISFFLLGTALAVAGRRPSQAILRGVKADLD
ncbi:hypothetical protein CKAH01_14081 [Colletotrichum kahawae]|uniref:Uncharacterized protein n=1 Tax=Colletotrichum kahawae TaxID=34407 RepID=A0AAD9YNA8_COLKA|nr:hypothetical protein CKAH01_14081 [Colletotrichum kahawae]